MPITLSSPQYGPSRDGLVANYTASFSGDLNIILPLYGSFQGDAVEAMSLCIDNYSNASPVAYTMGGTTGYVPAYTREFVPVKGLGYVNLMASIPMTIGLYVHNNAQTGSISRGQPPNGISDPMFSSVLGLWLFDSNNGNTIAIDAKNSGSYLDRRGVALISNLQSEFSSTSAINPGGYVNPATEVLPVGPFSGDYTFEYSVYAVTAYAVGSAQNPTGFNVLYTMPADSSGLTGLIFGYETNGTNIRFSIYQLVYDGGSNFHMVLACATPYSYSLNTWYQIAVTTIGNLTIYVGGVVAAQSGSKLLNEGIVILFGNCFPLVSGPATYPSGECFVSQTRLTLGTRYTKNYTPSGQEFPTQ